MKINNHSNSTAHSSDISRRDAAADCRGVRPDRRDKLEAVKLVSSTSLRWIPKTFEELPKERCRVQVEIEKRSRSPGGSRILEGTTNNETLLEGRCINSKNKNPSYVQKCFGVLQILKSVKHFGNFRFG